MTNDKRYGLTQPEKMCIHNYFTGSWNHLCRNKGYFQGFWYNQKMPPPEDPDNSGGISPILCPYTEMEVWHIYLERGKQEKVKTMNYVHMNYGLHGIGLCTQHCPNIGEVYC